MLNEKFWLAIAFLSFIILAIKYFGPSILKALDNKSKEIAEEILAAKEIRKKAEKFLAEAEKYYQESLQYSRNLLKEAEVESQKFIKESQKMLEDEINDRTELALGRLEAEEVIAIREIKTRILASAIKTVAENLNNNMNKKHHDHLISQATKDFEKIIH
jgi:F0F1-type ATP synthase membrane subunit b/b'